MNKLEKYGIRGIAYNWIKDYISNRKQYVMFDSQHLTNMSSIVVCPRALSWGHFYSFFILMI